MQKICKKSLKNVKLQGTTKMILFFFAKKTKGRDVGERGGGQEQQRERREQKSKAAPYTLPTSRSPTPSGKYVINIEITIAGLRETCESLPARASSSGQSCQLDPPGRPARSANRTSSTDQMEKSLDRATSTDKSRPWRAPERPRGAIFDAILNDFG